jgi:hypothetical protein
MEILADRPLQSIFSEGLIFGSAIRIYRAARRLKVTLSRMLGAQGGVLSERE